MVIKERTKVLWNFIWTLNRKRLWILWCEVTWYGLWIERDYETLYGLWSYVKERTRVLWSYIETLTQLYGLWNDTWHLHDFTQVCDW